MSNNASLLVRVKEKGSAFSSGVISFFKSPASYIRIGVVLVLIALAFSLWYFGKEHQFLFDNKTFDGSDGVNYRAPNYISVSLDGGPEMEITRNTRFNAFDRSQAHKMSLKWVEGGAEKSMDVKFNVPTGWKTNLINLPAVIAGADEDIWLSEFISATPAPSQEDSTIITDEFSSDF